MGLWSNASSLRLYASEAFYLLFIYVLYEVDFVL